MSEPIRIDGDALIRDESGKVVGRVISTREDEHGITVGLRYTDRAAFMRVLQGGEPEPVGEGLGWSNGICSSEYQQCDGTFDPQRGCRCV
jgi:hypothetical protein